MFSAVNQQAIALANVDPDLNHRTASLDYNELNGRFGEFDFINVRR